MFERKSREDAATVIPFPEGTQAQFDIFADAVCALVDGAHVEFQAKPILGRPYAVIWLRDEVESENLLTYTLIVDAGQAFCKDGDEIWVAD